jgi:hypothetical protein
MPNKKPEAEAAQRKCLGCSKVFLSMHIGNRMCPMCGLRAQQAAFDVARFGVPGRNTGKRKTARATQS